MAFDWKGTIGAVAPVLAGMLGTPAAGVAVAGLCNALGLTPSAENAQAAAEKIAAGQLTGDQLIALRKAEAEAQLALQKAGLEYDLQEDTLVVRDRADARARQVALKDNTPAIGFYAITVGFFGLLICMLFHVIPQANERVLDVMVGSLGTAWIGAVNFYYGSTRGSQAKDQLLFQSQPVEGKR